MSKQPSIRLKTMGGLDLELCAHRDGMLYSARLELDDAGVAFFTAHTRCEFGAAFDVFWMDSACITLTVDSAIACAQFLADTADYRDGKA